MKDNSLRSNIIIISALCAFAVYLFFGVLNHEAWRDEWHQINIARAFTSLPDLYTRLRYEGHPPFWFLTARVAWEVYPTLASVQFINAIFAVIAAGLIAFFAPWPLWLRLFAAFTGPAAWEYSIKARGYGLGWLIVVIIALLLRKPDSRAKFYLLLLLAILALNTTAFSGIIAYALIAGWMWLLLCEKKYQQLFLSVLVLALATIVTALLLRPMPGVAHALAPEKIVSDGISALSTLFAVTLLPCHGMDWSYLPYLTILVFPLVFLCFYSLCFDGAARVSLFSGWTVCMLFVVYKSGVQPWYMWHLFLLPFVVSIAFEKRSPLPRKPLIILGIMALLGCNAGIREYIHDRTAIYSAAKSAAEGIRSAGLSGLPIVVYPDFFNSSLSGYLGRPLHDGACRGEETYTLWLNKRPSELESFKCAVGLARSNPEHTSLFTHPDMLRDDVIEELSAKYGVRISLVGSYIAAGNTDYRFGTEEHFNVYLLSLHGLAASGK